MARLSRRVLAGCPHLVLQHTLEGRTAFVDDTDRQYFMQVLREGLAAEQVQLHAYSIGDDALRLLATPSTAQALSRLMQSIGRHYVAGYNRRHGHHGPLWDGRFRACVVEPGEAVLAAMQWVVQAGEGHCTSSAGHHAGLHRDPLVTDPPAYWALGNTPFEREAAWREVLDVRLSQAQKARLQGAVMRGWAIGSVPFIESASRRMGRTLAPRPRGRPRRDSR